LEGGKKTKRGMGRGGYMSVLFPKQFYPVKKGWFIKYIGEDDPGYGASAFYNKTLKTITIRYKKGTWTEIHARNHEIGHSYGVIGCRRPWCLMWEIQTWIPKMKDSWVEKLAAPLQLLCGLKYCKKCEKQINDAYMS
jgi:hypothetical protein